MDYLLDTCVLSDFVKGDSITLKKLKTTSPNQIAVSSITIMEINYGLSLNPQRKKIIEPIMNDFLGAITVLNFNEQDASHSANIRAYLKQQGRPIGAYDILIAGTALNHQLILVTSNTNEFNRIHNLRLENWRLDPEH